MPPTAACPQTSCFLLLHMHVPFLAWPTHNMQACLSLAGRQAQHQPPHSQRSRQGYGKLHAALTWQAAALAWECAGVHGVSVVREQGGSRRRQRLARMTHAGLLQRWGCTATSDVEAAVPHGWPPGEMPRANFVAARGQPRGGRHPALRPD